MPREEINKEKLLEEFKNWAFEIIIFCRKLPTESEYKIIKNQLIRSATSTAANYSASNRAKSKADVLYKRKLVEEELDESLIGLDFLERLMPSEIEKISEFKAQG